MKKYIVEDKWSIIEEGFDPALNKISESIFSLGNGRMGHRANFEEYYSGETLQGNYIAGVYYPDKTRVGWWKNGYPEYFAKVLNAANWAGLDLHIDDQRIDLAACKIIDFRRELNMKKGFLERTFTIELNEGKRLKIESLRFLSIVDDEIGALRYRLTALNFDAKLDVKSFIDGDVKNQDANYDEKFWEEIEKINENNCSYLTLRTKKTEFEVCSGTSLFLNIGDELFDANFTEEFKQKYISLSSQLPISKNIPVTIYKIVANLSSENYSKDKLLTKCKDSLNSASIKGFDQLLLNQEIAWANKWKESDISIEGDIAAQQGIRFNIFQLNQTYTGNDPRLNIGPKGFTGEKYGGSTYWDTEAYCIPFYLATASPEVSRNLLIYRYKHLEKAIQNAKLLGFDHGAALFPMVTMNGEECHNEWEITFEEIHRNGAIAYAIFNYIRYTDDQSYLEEYGLEVLLAIARFWKQRVNWSTEKNQYVILGVTGPNEYENNINNNWYTNKLAVWCLKYAIEATRIVKQNNLSRYREIVEKVKLNEQEEFLAWDKIISNMYFPVDDKYGIFLQQDAYLDKEQLLVKDLSETELPLNQKWSWDRILRSCFIKQADVLQGIYFFEDEFDTDTIRRNFDFYEPRTVHESSLSPCLHSIIASRLNDVERAYEFYLRTARLDLDDYNNDTEDGLHITSMAGTWMSVVEGFAGMRVRDGILSFNPFLPEKWTKFSFTIRFKSAILTVSIEHEFIQISNCSNVEIEIIVQGAHQLLAPNSIIKAEYGLNLI
jgi:maltose phosphorylase